MKKRKLMVRQVRKASILTVGILLLVLTIGYATLDAKLNIAGKVNMEYKRTDVYIDKIINKVVSDGGEEQKAPIYHDTEANFQIKTPAGTSAVEYDVVIQNNSEEVKWLSKVETLLNTNDSNIIYEISGFEVGDAIKPGEAKTSHVKIRMKDGITSIENPITLLNVLFQFEKLDWKSVQAEFLSEVDSGDLSTSTDGVIFEVKVTNPNPVSVDYYITSNNARFTITDATTGKIGYQLEAKASATHRILIKLREDVTYENILEEILLLLRTTYPVSEDVNIHKVTLKLPSNLKNTVLNSKEIQNAPTNYTGIEENEGYLVRTNEIDDISYTYYYRGVVENNYVNFAGYLWRIVRVDSNGNVRIVLNDNVSTSSKYNQNYSKDNVETIEAAEELVDYRNSNVRSAVETWYNSNIVPNEDSRFVVNSNFCIDFSYQGPITTKDGNTVYYFTPYLHVGRDSSENTPDFTCSSEKIFTSSVGLLTAEEILAAGGYWERVNNKYYLYNKDSADGANQTSWTMSGSYYSISEKQAGVIVFNQDKGSLFDWVQGGNLTQNYGYRPVISLNGNAKVTGDGTKANPFKLIG